MELFLNCIYYILYYILESLHIPTKEREKLWYYSGDDSSTFKLVMETHIIVAWFDLLRSQVSMEKPTLKAGKPSISVLQRRRLQSEVACDLMQSLFLILFFPLLCQTQRILFTACCFAGWCLF